MKVRIRGMPTRMTTEVYCWKYCFNRVIMPLVPCLVVVCSLFEDGVRNYLKEVCASCIGSV